MQTMKNFLIDGYLFLAIGLGTASANVFYVSTVLSGLVAGRARGIFLGSAEVTLRYFRWLPFSVTLGLFIVAFAAWLNIVEP